MAKLIDVLSAGRVARWHQNPQLSWTKDHLDGHQGRVARFFLALWPSEATAAVLINALIHDDGELVSGDIAAIYGKTPEHQECEKNAQKKIWGNQAPITKRQEKQIRLCDKLDAYAWMLARDCNLQHRPDWRAALRNIHNLAGEIDGPNGTSAQAITEFLEEMQ